MAAPQPPVPASLDKNLPAVTIDGHALFDFSMKINRALKRMETRFGAQEKNLIPTHRKSWQPPPRKPR
jgi:hypothetical protein